VIVIYHNDGEFIACDPSDEPKVRELFFKTRKEADFTRTVVGDFAYVRATATKNPSDGELGPPRLLVSTNLSFMML
jgi:hypothetical protein